MCALDFFTSGKAGVHSCSVGSFCLQDQLPSIEVVVHFVLKDARRIASFLLFRPVPSMSVESVVIAKQFLHLVVGVVVEILPPVRLFTICFHGRGNAALQAGQQISGRNGSYLCVVFFSRTSSNALHVHLMCSAVAACS